MEMRRTIEMEASADQAWQVLGERFGDIAQWSSTLATSSLQGTLGVGATRVCQGTGFGPFPPGEVTEELVEFDREQRAFTYVGRSGLPAFVRQAQNRWRVESLGPDRCAVHMHATLQVAWWAAPFAWLMPFMMRAALRGFAEEMTAEIEGKRLRVAG